MTDLCDAASVSECWPKIHDNGLTYADYRAGKSDLAKDADIARDLAEQIAREARKFLKDPVGTVSGWF